MKLALVGATGLVGQKMIQVLQERNVAIDTFIPVASAKSVGSSIDFNGKSVQVVDLEKALSLKPEVALFSAGGEMSKHWAPKFAAINTIVIDNSSAWRMEKNIPLCVPEINANSIAKSDRIIANPNCSTIQMVMALAPLHKEYGIKRIVVSTYQSISGTGKKAVDQLMNERTGATGEKVYPHPIDMNCLPHCDVFEDNGYTKEELKLVNETRKILSAPEIGITATAVRVPVIGGHSESINVEFNNKPDLSKVVGLLSKTPGLVVYDTPSKNEYPMPLTAHEKDDVFVGRIRLDESNPLAINLWVVADNLRKGAATNAVQILQNLIERKFV